MVSIETVVKDPKLLGKFGESIAAEYLLKSGYIILAKNWRVKEGELDLVAQKGDTVIAVEVKTRTNLNHGSPFEAITPIKLKRLRKLFAMWLQTAPKYYEVARIDAIAVTCLKGENPKISHFKAIS